MFLKGGIFEKLLCCRRKLNKDENEDEVQEEIVLQHTNNNKTEYITSTQLMERLKGGTTAVVALLREKRLVVAWLGDSLALLVRKRTPVHIVQPHKPEAPSERKRIEEFGGCVVNIHGTWRVLGQLAVSRAIGDVSYKPYVTSECDIKSLEICGDEDFLILACDGLWDNLSPENAVNIVYSYLLNNDGDTDGVGRCLVEAARSLGSKDNITAIVVFLRAVNVLMEEETARIAQGQVPEMDSFVMTQKDGLPPSITAIFSPPENFNSSPSPSAEVSNDANGPQPLEEPPMPLPVEDNEADQPQDYDSDEGVGEDIAVEKGKISPEAEAHPTDEEVDAALAEIDSIPDGGCEAGEVEDDDDDDDEWSYYKMEPQKHSQTSNEDLIVTGTSEITVDTLPVTGGDLQHSPQTPESASFVKESSPCGSPQAPSSPRTVEGFVTSVELNTPEESYNTNLAINQSTEYFNGGQIEQSSGPFSVYVSSSPEPVSIESPPVNLLSPLIPSNAVEMQEEPKSDLGKEEIEELEGPSVEIVHAQSTVEVITDTPVEVEIPKDETVSPIPDIMTQSITGGLPSDPCVLSTVDEDKVPSPLFEDAPHFTEEAKQHTEVVIEESFTEQQFAAEVETEAISPDIGKITDTINVEEIVEDVKQETEATIEEMLIAVENIEQIPPNIPEPVDDDAVESESGKMASNQLEDQFTEEINKAFEVPLDQMIISFHEDRTQTTDLISSLEISVAPEEEAVELSQEVSSPVTSILETGVEELTEVTNLLETRVKALPEEVSQMQISEVIQKPTSPITIPISPIQTLEEEREPVSPVTTPVAATKPEMKRPSSAPRTTGSKPAPPKPSPRSVGSKLSTSRLSSTSSPTAAPTGPSPGVKGIPKRPTSLAAATASKPLRKLDSAKPSTTTSTAKTRASTTTTRASLSSATRTTTTTKPTAAAKTKATPKSTVPPAKTRATPPTAALKTTAAAAKSKVTTTTTTAAATTATTATTATRRLTPIPKPTSSTTTTRVSSTSKVPNGIASASKTMTKTTTTTTRKPLTTKTPTTTSSRVSSVPSTRKPLSAATKTATTTSTLKQRTVASAPAATKDTKNSTNRMLSTTKTSTTKSSSQPASRTSTTTKPRSFPFKTPKTQGLKGKKDGVKSPVAKPKVGESPMANGENKIVEEESTIEVKEKIMQEETTEVRESVIEETICSMSEKVIEEVSSIEDVTMKAEKMLVNGDH